MYRLALFAVMLLCPLAGFAQVSTTPTITIPAELVAPLKVYLLERGGSQGILVADRNGDGVITDSELSTWVAATARQAIRDPARAAVQWAERRNPELLPQALRDAEQAVRDAQAVLETERAKLRESSGQ
jgi:hypothetical protein